MTLHGQPCSIPRVTSWTIWWALSACSCSPAAPTFPTSEQVPRLTEQEPPRIPQVRSVLLLPSEHDQIQLVERLFLALSLGDRATISELLVPGAQLMRENQSPSLATNAAVDTLQSLFSASAATPAGRSSGGLAFVSAQVVALDEKARLKESEVSVQVDGAASIRGLWRVTVDGGQELKITKVVLPPES